MTKFIFGEVMDYVKLGDLCVINSGGTPRRNNESYWKNGDIPWVKISDLNKKKILKKEKRNKPSGRKKEPKKKNRKKKSLKIHKTKTEKAKR